jgi:hypothetical protein
LYWKTVLEGSKANEFATERRIPNPRRSHRRKGRYVGSKAVTAKILSAETAETLRILAGLVFL